MGLIVSSKQKPLRKGRFLIGLTYLPKFTIVKEVFKIYKQ
jgi:hypothetical protein